MAIRLWNARTMKTLQGFIYCVSHAKHISWSITHALTVQMLPQGTGQRQTGGINKPNTLMT